MAREGRQFFERPGTYKKKWMTLWSHIRKLIAETRTTINFGLVLMKYLYWKFKYIIKIITKIEICGFCEIVNLGWFGKSGFRLLVSILDSSYWCLSNIYDYVPVLYFQNCFTLPGSFPDRKIENWRKVCQRRIASDPWKMASIRWNLMQILIL